jgi:hypothetical protein
VELSSLILPAAAAGAVASGAAGAAWLLYSRFFVRPPPHRALVLFAEGARRPPGEPTGADRSVEIRSPRIVVGGSVFVAPWNRSFGYLSLAPVEVEVTVRALSAVSGGTASGWEARFGAVAKVPVDPPLLGIAAENLMGKGEEELRSVVRHAIENAVPSLLARLGPSDPAPDWDRLAAEVQAAAASDLVAVGLVLQSLSVRQLARIAPAAAAPPVARPALPRGGPTVAEAEERLHVGVDLRLARLERSVGVLGAQIDLLVREGTAATVRGLPGVRLEPPPAAAREPPALHDSMGGESPSRTRAPSTGRSAAPGGGEPRTLLDTESGG